MKFGTTGIRGTFGKDITPEIALKLGKTIGGLNKRFVVGYDCRTSNQVLYNSLVSGLMSVGSQVTSLGMVPTPTLAFNARNADYGIMITASHNPPDHNGIKIFNKDGSHISREKSNKIEEDYKKDIKCIDWFKLSDDINISNNSINNHIYSILRSVGLGFIGGESIIVDCANGTMGQLTPCVLSSMGCHVTTLNAQPEGRFLSHVAEPVGSNLVELMRFCKENKSYGIAHDFDGDRTIFVDNEGNIIDNDKLIVIIANHIKAKKVVLPVNLSRIMEENIKGEVVRYKIGDTALSQKLKEVGGDFSAEPSGHWIFPNHMYCSDGGYISALFVRMLHDINLKEELGKIKSYPIKRINIMVKDRDKSMKNIESFVKENNILVDLCDGIKGFTSKGWFLVRPSGTENKIRLTVEGNDKKCMRDIFDSIYKIING